MSEVRVADRDSGGLVIGAGLLLMLGSVLPWFHVFVVLGGNGSVSGVQTDGATTLVIGVLDIVLGILVKLAKGRLWVVIVGTVLNALGLAIIIAKLVDLFGLSDEIELGISFGIWVALVAAALCVLACARCLRRMIPLADAQL